MIKFYTLFFISIFFVLSTSAQSINISGIVQDSHTNEPITYASVYLEKSKIGQTTDSAGKFSFQLSHIDSDSLVISYVGYEPQKIEINFKNNSPFNISLQRGGANTEVVVRAKFNKGLYLWKKIMSKKNLSDLYRQDNFRYEAYNKLEVDIKDFDATKAQKNIFLKPFSFIFKTITSLSDSSNYFPAYLIESVSDYSFQRKPKKFLEKIKASNTKGFITSSISNLLGVMNQNINIYNNFITIMNKDFISPFNENADKYYSFSVPDTQVTKGDKLFHFVFKPQRLGINAFEGEAWVMAKTFQIKNITLYLGKDANINYIERISAFQEFTPTNDSMCFLHRDKFFADFKFTGNDKLTFIGRKSTSYKNIIINSDSINSFFKTQTAQKVIQSDEGAETLNESAWEKLRHDTLSINEKNIYKTIDSILVNPKYNLLQNTFKFLGSGYKDIGSLEIGKWYSLYSHNIWEGSRFQLDLGTNKKFSKNIHLHGYVAYGALDKVTKGKFEAFWIINRKPNWSKINFLFSSDINNGISSNTDMGQNTIFSSLIRKPNIQRKFIHIKNISLDLYKEWGFGFSTQFFISNQQYIPLKNLPLATSFPISSGTPLTNFEIALKFRFAYLEKFIENDYTRFSIGSEYPVLELQITKGIPAVLKSAYQFTKAIISMKGNIKIPPYGTIYYKVFAGKIYGVLPFTFLENHIGNDFYYYNTNSYNLINSFEYLSDKYSGIHLEHNLGSGLFRYFSLTRKMKLRQFWTAKALWGSLSHENYLLNNSSNFFKTLNKSTYMEVGTGVDNIFSVFRIDLVWRVLPQPLPINKTYRFGVFGSLHFKF